MTKRAVILLLPAVFASCSERSDERLNQLLQGGVKVHASREAVSGDDSRPLFQANLMFTIEGESIHLELYEWAATGGVKQSNHEIPRHHPEYGYVPRSQIEFADEEDVAAFGDLLRKASEWGEISLSENISVTDREVATSADPLYEIKFSSDGRTGFNVSLTVGGTHRVDETKSSYFGFVSETVSIDCRYVVELDESTLEDLIMYLEAGIPYERLRPQREQREREIEMQRREQEEREQRENQRKVEKMLR